MKEYIQALLAQRTVLLPAIFGIVGILLHARGFAISDRQMAALQQQFAALFDSLAVVAGVSSIRYSLSVKRTEILANKTVQNTEAISDHADRIDPTVNNPPGPPARVESLDVGKLITSPTLDNKETK